jgi:uncharacterized protein
MLGPVKVLSAVLIAVFVTAYPMLGFGASFDCRNARSSTEKLVCSSPELRSLDIRLYETYQRNLRQSRGEAERQLRTDQRQWIKDVRDRCKTNSCLSAAYEKRIGQLAARVMYDKAAGIMYAECKDTDGGSLGFGYCEGRKKEEAENTINDLSMLLAPRFGKTGMERFNRIQIEWRQNVACSCYDKVGWGSGPGHSAMIVACENSEVQQRLSEVREIIVGKEGLEYGGTGPRSCASIRQAEEADPEYQMFKAIRVNDLNTVKRLFEEGATAPVWRDGETPLSIAAQNNNAEMVKLLLSKGVSAKNDSKAISASLSHCNGEIASLLVDHGASVRPESWVNDPLPIAAYYGCTDVIKYLVSRGADIKSSRPLPMAASGCRVETVRYLISEGDDVHSRDRVSSTPLSRAADVAVKDPRRREACKAVIAELLKAGASPEPALNAARGDEEIKSLLLGESKRP